MNPDLNRELNVHDGEVFLVRKPLDWTSFDVVNKMRSIFHIEKIGHAGTLDRNAAGLLIVCTGKKTKEISSIQQSEKEYEVTMRLGERTESYDADTPVIERKDISALTSGVVENAIRKFIGWQTQMPPMWSAGKVAGRRLHAYAREGTEVERAPRKGFIKSIDIQDISLPDVEMTVVCSKGMYVRSLVHDIGNALGVGAHVVSLTRSRIGDFRLADAVTIDELIQKVYRN